MELSEQSLAGLENFIPKQALADAFKQLLGGVGLSPSQEQVSKLEAGLTRLIKAGVEEAITSSTRPGSQTEGEIEILKVKCTGLTDRFGGELRKILESRYGWWNFENTDLFRTHTMRTLETLVPSQKCHDWYSERLNRHEGRDSLMRMQKLVLCLLKMERKGEEISFRSVKNQFREGATGTSGAYEAAERSTAVKPPHVSSDIPDMKTISQTPLIEKSPDVQASNAANWLVRAFWKECDEGDREIIGLDLKGEYRLEEIGRMTDRRASAVRSRLSRCYARILAERKNT